MHLFQSFSRALAATALGLIAASLLSGCGGSSGSATKRIIILINGDSPFWDACRVGVPDAEYGEEICAWIRMKPGRRSLDADAVRAFATGKVAHYKIPRYVHVVDEFPMTVTGKVRKVDMRAESARLFGLEAPHRVEDT